MYSSLALSSGNLGYRSTACCDRNLYSAANIGSRETVRTVRCAKSVMSRAISGHCEH